MESDRVEQFLEIENARTSGLHQGEGPGMPYVHLFPQSLENRWRAFDDPIIKFVQSNQNKVSLLFSKLVTLFTAIESIVIAPFILFMLNQDEFASYMMICALICSLVSQLPKRFLWRYRPYVVRRAVQIGKDKTSSFPSRAVTGGTVFAMAICVGYNLSHSNPAYDIEWWMPFLYIGLPLSASFSRIYFGVHYPSDCVGGFVQGNVIMIFSSLMFESLKNTCESCLHDDCYTKYSDENGVIDIDHMDTINWGSLIGFSLLGLVFVFLSSMKPLEFWVKCHYVYGLIWPVVVFRLSFLCPSINPSGSSLPSPGNPEVGAYFLCALVGSVTTAVGYKTKGTNMILRIAVYSFIHLSIIITLSLWRMIH